MTDVLFVQPPLPSHMAEFSRSMILCPPLGLGYLASILIQEGFNVKIVDMAALNQKVDELKSELSREEPSIVAITTTTQTYKNAIEVARLSKSVNPETYTIIGGPHVTFTAEDTLQDMHVDFVVRGEGEFTMLELTKALLRSEGDVRDVKGVSYRKDDRVVNNPSRPLIQDLDCLPFPARELFRKELYRLPGSIITSRGCPSRCIFCSAGAMWGRIYRFRSPENVIDEIEHMSSNFDIDTFFIADDTFTIVKDRVRRICGYMKKFDFQWFCEARVNTVNKEVLEDMAESGCKVIQYGVESGSQKILNSIRKGITLSQARRAVELTSKAGILPVCSFMFPHPEDTVETAMETKNFMNELSRLGAVVLISMTTPFPGTYLYDHAEELGLTIVLRDTDRYDMVTPVFRTRYLSIEQIEEVFDKLVSFCISQEKFQHYQEMLNDKKNDQEKQPQ